jgi:hypothetical protein
LADYYSKTGSSEHSKGTRRISVIVIMQCRI